jgi:hypothetical protein
MKNLFYIIIASILFSCASIKEDTKRQVIKGDLYYKWLNLVNFYNIPDSIYQKFQSHLDTTGLDGLKKEDPKAFKQVSFLIQNNLLKTPFIHLITNDTTIGVATIFIDSTLYQPLTKFNYKELIKNKEKIQLEIEVQELKPKVFKTIKINSIQKVKGQTLQRQKKFKIENYR